MQNNNEIRLVRVLQVFGSLNMGGAECRMMDVYRNIDKSDVQFDFVTLTCDKQYFEDEIIQLEGNIIRIRSPREIGILKHISQLRKCMRDGKYTAVHAHTSYHCGMVMLAAFLEHIPVRIAHARTNGSKSQSKSQLISLLLGRVLINLFATKKLAISKSAGRYVFGNNAFEVLPNAIDTYKYQIEDIQEINNLKNELLIKDSDFVIGQIGRFDPMKNHSFTLKWFHEFIKSVPNSKLILIGDGPLKKEMMELSDSLGVSDRVIFTGIRDDVYKILHIMNVLFFPSQFEGLGGVAIEAQAAGVPVVESDAIPDETDLCLGLVKRVSLNDSFSKWTEAVLNSREVICPSYDTINQMFSQNKYVLSETVNRLVQLYKGYS